MKCPNCGEWNSNQSYKCVNCGRLLPQSKPAQAQSTPQKSSKGFWEENGHLIAHVAMKLLFG